MLAGLAPATAYILVPTRPTAEPWAKPASDEAVTRAYATFAHALPRVETITGEGPGEFGFTGNVIDDLLGITAVHPMREREVRDLLAKAEADWSVVEALLAKDALRRIAYRGTTYYIRRGG